MTTKEANSRWQIPQNKISEMCKYGLIVECEKNAIRHWQIEDTALKPPFKLHQAVNILRNILQQNQGVSVTIFPSKSNIDHQSAIEYLSNYAFISECNNISDIVNAVVTERGIDLIQNYTKKNKTVTNSISGNLNLGGVASINATHSVTK
ncbi:MAG: hypothetical protein IJS61_09795 [Firmicutes bacterium]|nr:hypothetical protein [Bacillota bacterium]